MITRRGEGEKLSTYYLIGETERGEKDNKLRKTSFFQGKTEDKLLLLLLCKRNFSLLLIRENIRRA